MKTPKPLNWTLTRREAIASILGPPFLYLSTTFKPTAKTETGFLERSREYWAQESGGWRKNQYALLCRLALKWNLDGTGGEILQELLLSTVEQLERNQGGEKGWKTKKIATACILGLNKEYNLDKSNTVQQQLSRVFFSEEKNPEITKPSKILGVTANHRGGGTPNMRLVHATCGLLMAQLLKNDKEIKYTENWLDSYFDLREQSFGSEHLSTYQIIYDEMFALLYQYLPQKHRLRLKVGELLNWHAICYSAHTIDGWICSANLRDKRTSRHVIVPHLLFKKRAYYTPPPQTKSILYGLSNGMGGFVVNPEVAEQYDSARMAIGYEILENDPPSSKYGEINPKWSRALFRYRTHSMSTIRQVPNIRYSNPLKLKNEDTFLHPSLFKVAINNRGICFETYVTHPATGVNNVGRENKIWSSHFEWRYQFRNAYLTIGNLVHGEAQLRGPFPYESADEMLFAMDDWLLVRWGHSILAIWASGNISLHSTSAYPNPELEAQQHSKGSQITNESISISSDSRKRCSAIWTIYHVDQVRSLDNLKKLLLQNAQVSWLSEELSLFARIPVVQDNASIAFSDIGLTYGIEPEKPFQSVATRPGNYHFL